MGNARIEERLELGHTGWKTTDGSAISTSQLSLPHRDVTAPVEHKLLHSSRTLRSIEISKRKEGRNITSCGAGREAGCYHDSCAICLYVPCAPGAPKPSIRRNIGKRTNSIVAYLRAPAAQSMPGLTPTARSGPSTRTLMSSSPHPKIDCSARVTYRMIRAYFASR